MRYAIATEGGHVSAHFGHCPAFTIVDIDEGAVTNTAVVESPQHEPGAIPLFLKKQGANAVVSGGMGQRAADLFAKLEITPIVGFSGTVEAAIAGCLDGMLEGSGDLCEHDGDGHESSKHQGGHGPGETHGHHDGHHRH